MPDDIRHLGLEVVMISEVLFFIQLSIRSVSGGFFAYSFIHSGHFYSASSSPLLLRGTPDYSVDIVSEFHAEAHRYGLWVKLFRIDSSFT